MSNDRGQGTPPKAPLGSPPPQSSSPVGRPLRGPQSSSIAPGRLVPESRIPPKRPDELAHLYRKIADLQADTAEAEARAVKAEREQTAAEELLRQMLARVADIEGRLRVEQKRAADGEAAVAQAAKLRASQSEMQDRLQTVDAQNERLRVELTHTRREASTHRLAADDQLHLLAKEREESAALRARVAALEAAASARAEALSQALSQAPEPEAPHKPGVALERDISANLEQAWVEIRHAHASADAIAEQLAEAQRGLERERAATAEARAELARIRAAHEQATASLREAHTADLAEALVDRSRHDRSAGSAELTEARQSLARQTEALAEARRLLDAERAAVAEAQSLLAGEREWVAEMEEDSLRREDDLEKVRRAQSRADAHARAAEAQRAELEDALAEAERALVEARGERESLRSEAATLRLHAAELERERDLHAERIDVDAVPAEIERLRRRVASAEARSAEMHGELEAAISEVAHLLGELERRDLETARARTASLATARTRLADAVATTRPVARPAIEAATTARAPKEAAAPPEASAAALEENAAAPEPSAAPPEPSAAVTAQPSNRRSRKSKKPQPQ